MKLLAYFFAVFSEQTNAKENAKQHCNYANDYYGDQLCRIECKNNN